MMLYVLFIGDLVVMAGIIGLGAWLFLRQDESVFKASARIPLEDDKLYVEEDDANG